MNLLFLIKKSPNKSPQEPSLYDSNPSDPSGPHLVPVLIPMKQLLIVYIKYLYLL